MSSTKSNTPSESKILSANDIPHIDDFEKTLSNTAAGDLESFTQTEEAILREVRDELGNINEEKFTSLDGNIRFPKDKVITEEGRGVARSVGVVQTTPGRVLAHLFHIDSDVEMAIHVKANGPDLDKYPNKTIQRVAFHHQINYSCRKLPFPLQARDWLTRAVFAPLENKKGYIVATKSIPDDDPDVPNDFKRSTLENRPIRGEYASLSIFEELPFGCTKFTYLARADIRGKIPKLVAESGLAGLVNTVKVAYECFERDDEVDKLQRDDFIDSVENAQLLTSDEQSLLHRSLGYAGFTHTYGGGLAQSQSGVSESQREKWTRLRNDNFAVKKFTKLKEGDSAMWGKATAQIHTSAAEAFAWMWFYCSNFRTKQHMKKQGDDMIRQNYGITDGNTQHIVVHHAMPMGLNMREAKVRLVWRKFDDKLVIAVEPSDISFSDGKLRGTSPKTTFGIRRVKTSPSSVSPISTRNSNDVEADSKVVQVHNNGVWIFDRKADNICDVTFVNRSEDKGNLPTKIVNSTIGRSLDVVSQLKRFFERNGGAVDQELRGDFMVKIPEVTNNDDQRDIIEEQMGKVDLNDDKWEPLEKNSSAFVKLSKIHVKGESNAWGRASATIDASAEKVVAWFWDYCSNERIATVRNFEKNPRELIKSVSDNHNIFSTVKTMPWPSRTRQFVFENTWMKREDGSFVYAFRPPQTDAYDDITHLDLAKKSRRMVIRGELWGFVTIKPDGASSCTITYVKLIDLKGHTPPKIMDLQIPIGLKHVFQLRDKFNRDDEIDKIEQERLMAIMRNSDKEVYSLSEEQLIDSVQKMKNITEDLFQPLKSPDFRTKMSLAHIDGENCGIMRCETTIDTYVEDCAAYNFLIMSRKRMRDNEGSATVYRQAANINNHALHYNLIIDLGFGLNYRRFLSHQVWKRTEDGGMIIVFRDISESDLFRNIASENKNRHIVTAHTSGYYWMMPEKNGCTKLIVLMQVDLGGIIPAFVADSRAVDFLSDYGRMRNDHNRDREIDERSRSLIISKIDDDSIVLTEEEENDIQRARDHFKVFNNSEGSKFTLNTGDEFLSAVGGKAGGKIWCKLSTTIRCSGVEALAFVMDITSRSLLSEHDVMDGKRVLMDEGHTRVFKVVEEDSSRGGLHLLREIVRKISWGQGQAQTVRHRDEILVSMIPTVFDTPAANVEGEFPDKTIAPKISKTFSRVNRSRSRTQMNQAKVKYVTACFVKIDHVKEDECNIEMLVDLPKKYKPRKIIKDGKLTHKQYIEDTRISLGASLKDRKEASRLLTSMYDYRVLSTMQRCIQRWRPLGMLNQEEGTAMGKMLMENTTGLFNTRERSKKARKAKLEWFFGEFESMKTLKVEHGWFATMMAAVILGTKEKGTSNASLCKIDLLTASDGYTLGSSFLYYMGRSANEDGAVGSWLDKHPALGQFYHQHKFFVPLMKEIGKTMRHTETWHKVVKSGSSGLFSLFDVGSDIYSILYYRRIGETEVADMMMVFLVLSLGLQMVFVVAAHHKHRRRMLTELLKTLTFSKPAFNKWKVLTNARVEDHVIVPPVTEMMMFKMGEVFAESIPVTVLQVNTLLTMEELDPIVVVSLLVSVIFVSEAVTYMTYVKDISEESRKTGRLFYGFMPLGGMRMVLVKGSMYVLSFCQLMGKSITIGILVQIGGKRTALAVLGCEVGIYLLYKVLRKDFRYFLPLPNGTSLAVSLLFRVALKVITDFTGMLHARHPYEMGGAYWMFNMFYTQVMLFIVVNVRSSTYSEEGQNPVFSEEKLWILACSLSALWLVAVVVLLLSCEKGFMHTFFQLTRAWEYNKAMFDTGDDGYRMYIFTDHEAYYMWYKEEIKEWLDEAWDRLHREKPVWFTQNVVKSVPIDILPNMEHESVVKEMAQETKIEREKRRKLRSVARVMRFSLGINDFVSERNEDGYEEILDSDGNRSRRETSARERVLKIAAEVRNQFDE